MGLLYTLSGVIIIESILFYAWKVPSITHGIVFLLLVALLFWKRTRVRSTLRDTIRALHLMLVWPLRTKCMALVLVILSASSLWFLSVHQITDAVRSPWDMIPYTFFVLTGALIVCEVLLLRTALQAHRDGLAWFAAAIGSLPFVLLAHIVFPIGYGFDPFIHQATEKIIAVSGVITPKPMYYVGQYVLVTFLSTISGISVTTIDSLLVPLLAATLIPWFLIRWIRSTTSTHGWIAPLAVLALPFVINQFTITTPQAFANLLFISLLFLRKDRIVPWVLVPAIFFIHPLTGIASVLFIGATLLRRTWHHIAWACAGLFFFPAAFVTMAALSPGIAVTFTPWLFIERLASLSWSGVYRENRFNGLLNAVYFYAFNIKLIFLLVASLSLFKRWRDYAAHLFTTLSLFGGAFLLHTLFSFEFLIGYEQTDYTERVALLGLLSLLPIFLDGSMRIVELLWQRGVAWRAGTITVTTLAALAGLFLAYPQHVDGYAVNRSWNTSASDIEAVRWIDLDAQGRDYIVLANQAVSAAAIRELGFKKYFPIVIPNSAFTIHNSQFLYPLPTGSPLYQYYLSMVNVAPTAETLRAAGDLVTVSRVYFVLNRYWNNFDQLQQQARNNLKLIHSINNEVLIFSLE